MKVIFLHFPSILLLTFLFLASKHLNNKNKNLFLSWKKERKKFEMFFSNSFNFLFYFILCVKIKQVINSINHFHNKSNLWKVFFLIFFFLVSTFIKSNIILVILKMLYIQYLSYYWFKSLNLFWFKSLNLCYEMKISLVYQQTIPNK